MLFSKSKLLNPGEFGYIPVLSEYGLVLENNIKNVELLMDSMHALNIMYAPEIDRNSDSFAIIVTLTGKFFVIDYKIKFNSKKIPKKSEPSLRSIMASFRLAYQSMESDRGVLGVELVNISNYTRDLIYSNR